jgi:hypothetical protein
MHRQAHYPFLFGTFEVIGGSLKQGLRIPPKWIEQWRAEATMQTQMMQMIGTDNPLLKGAPPAPRFDGTESGEVILKAGASLCPIMDSAPSPGACWVWVIGNYDPIASVFEPDITTLQVDYRKNDPPMFVGQPGATVHEVYSGEEAYEYLLGERGLMLFSKHEKAYLWTREDARDWMKWTAYRSHGIDPDSTDFDPQELDPPFDFARYLPIEQKMNSNQ